MSAKSPMTPNRERIKLWIDALRSGEFKQGRGALEWRGCNCPVGVAYRVAMRNGLTIQVEDVHGLIVFDGGALFGSLLLWDWFGLPYQGSIISWRGMGLNIMNLNDNERLSFAQIADLMEQQWLAPQEVK